MHYHGKPRPTQLDTVLAVCICARDVKIITMRLAGEECRARHGAANFWLSSFLHANRQIHLRNHEVADDDHSDPVPKLAGVQANADLSRLSPESRSLNSFDTQCLRDIDSFT
jgi:hypothetical protein